MSKVIKLSDLIDLADGLSLEFQGVNYNLDISFKAVMLFNQWLEKYTSNPEDVGHMIKFYEIILPDTSQRQLFEKEIEKYSIKKANEIFEKIFVIWTENAIGQEPEVDKKKVK